MNAIHVLAGSPTPTQWTSIGVVTAIVLGVVGMYFQFSQKATARAAAEDKRKKDAIQPYLDQIAQLRADQAAAMAQLRLDHGNALNELRRSMQAQVDQRDDVITSRNRTIELREARIDLLEDQLRGQK